MKARTAVSVIVSWRDRRELRLALPKLVELAERLHGEVVVVNFGGSALLLHAELEGLAARVRVATIHQAEYFNKAAAQNYGASQSRFPILFFCDCDCIIDPVSLGGTVAKLAKSPRAFATLAAVRESVRNSRRANHLVRFGYTLHLRTADGRDLSIVDNEEDAEDGSRQAPGLLIVKRKDFMRIGGYNSRLHGWGWEDQDMISRLTLGLGLRRITEGTAVHVSHGDEERLRHYPAVCSRWESRDRMFRQALFNYDRNDFMGTYTLDAKNDRDEQRSGQTAPRSATRAAAKAPEPPLSICMIARDEAVVLARCLSSVEGFAREICLVDTGSRDETAAIAHRFGAKVRRFTACNSRDGRIQDFSAPRNVSLEMATQEWVLQIDPDEVLLAGRELLREAINSPAIDRVGVSIRSNGASWISGRLFRRKSAGTYIGRIHEYIECSGAYAVQPQIVIENLEDKTGKESADARNIRLLRRSLREDQSNARLHHYLGNEYRARQQWERAARCYRNAIRLGTFRHGLFHSHYYLAICLLLQQKLDAAIEMGLAAVRIDPRYAEGHCLLADAYSCLGETVFAKIWYQNALACGSPPEDAVLPIQHWAYSEHPKRRLRAIGDGGGESGPKTP